MVKPHLLWGRPTLPAGGLLTRGTINIMRMNHPQGGEAGASLVQSAEEASTALAMCGYMTIGITSIVPASTGIVTAVIQLDSSLARKSAA